MIVLTTQGARLLTREELLDLLKATVRPKARRDKFEQLKAAAIAKADAVLNVQFVR